MTPAFYILGGVKMIWINILRVVGTLICGIKISQILEERKKEKKPEETATITFHEINSKSNKDISGIIHVPITDSTAFIRDQIHAGFVQQTRATCDQIAQMDNTLKIMQDALKRQAEDAVIKKLEYEIAYLKTNVRFSAYFT